MVCLHEPWLALPGLGCWDMLLTKCSAGCIGMRQYGQYGSGSMWQYGAFIQLCRRGRRCITVPGLHHCPLGAVLCLIRTALGKAMPSFASMAQQARLSTPLIRSEGVALAQR